METEMVGDTLAEFSNDCKKLWHLKGEIEELERPVTVKKKELADLKTVILKKMTVAEKKSEHLEGYGKIVRKMQSSTIIPRDREDVQSLLEWVRDHKGEDVMWGLVRLASKKLKPFYEDELELAVGRGDVDWSLQGLQEPKIGYSLAMIAEKK